MGRVGGWKILEGLEKTEIIPNPRGGCFGVKPPALGFPEPGRAAGIGARLALLAWLLLPDAYRRLTKFSPRWQRAGS